MKREDAFFHKLMLMEGLDGGYDEWLNTYLESEDPLSDIVLELACCGSDINKTISVLDSFCGEQPIDEGAVCARLRLFLKDAYYENRMSKEEIVIAMYHLARNVGDPGDFDMEIWGDMYYLDHYYDLAKDGILSWDRFDLVFFDFLDNGTPVAPSRIWNEKRHRFHWLYRIKKILFGKNSQPPHQDFLWAIHESPADGQWPPLQAEKSPSERTGICILSHNFDALFPEKVDEFTGIIGKSTVLVQVNFLTAL